MNTANFNLQPNTLPIVNLGHLGFQAYVPRLSLSAWVQCYWIAQRDVLPVCGYTEKLYPDGGSTLTFYFSDTQLPSVLFDARHSLSSSHFSGRVNCLGVRFLPGGAYQLFGQQIAELNDKKLPADELQLTRFTDLQQQLAETQINSQRIQLIDDWLWQLAQKCHAQTGLIQYLWPRFNSAISNIEQLTDTLSVSRRQIERKFQSEVGLSPAYVKLLHNIKFARRLIATEPSRLLTDIGLECGFYDQAHFIRQFRKVTAQTPGQYRQRKLSQIYNSKN